MREIKFRGVANREGGGIELVYGDLSTNCNDGCVYKDTHPDRISWRTETGGFASKPIRKGTRMQNTGLKDKNGKEIFEGDLVRVDLTSDDISEEYRGRVFIWTANMRLGDDETHNIAILEPSHLEIIGNIFTNPELLEQ